MNNQNNQRQLLLGVFFIVALSILAFYTLFLTDIHVFSKPNLMTVYFPAANRLREGDPVEVLGARFGRVKQLEYDDSAEPGKQIRALLSLDREVELLHDARITIRESSFLGGRHVEIDPGTFGGPPLEPLPDGAYLGKIEKNPIAMLGDLGSLLNENREQIRNFLSNADAIVADVRAGNGLLGMLISDRELGQRAADFVSNIRDASEQMQGGQGLLGALLYDPALKDTATAGLESFSRVGQKLDRGEGTLGKLLADDGLGKELDQVVANFKTASEDLSSITTRVRNGEGAMGRLLADEGLEQQLDDVVGNFRTASEDFKAITAQLRGGEGTIGKLLADDSMYKELQRAVGLFNRSLEDYREAAPITAFTAVLFAAF